MADTDNDDELILGALECYQRAIRRVAADFAGRGATVQPWGVDLDAPDLLIVHYRTPGRESCLGSLPVTRDVEQAVVELADVLQEKEFSEGDTSWPGCAAGDTHPPRAALVNGVAHWQCPQSQAPLFRIG
ncbi:hypothetical protein [Micromonospora zamorensis]|uniref:hypothetical protein n=1 Tax=Micromonospora zamorensis TaxID=709883 RepID=UPI003CF7715C